MRVIDYSPTEQHLKVELPSFPVYEVFDLSPTAFAALQTAEDPSAYFYGNIWGTKFEHASNWASVEELLGYIQENFTFEPPVAVSSRAGDGDTPLHLAAVWGDISAVDLLLAAGADPHAKGGMSCTALYNAVTFEHYRTAKRLLSAGARIDDQNELGFTAREAALQSKNERIRRLFSSEA